MRINRIWVLVCMLMLFAFVANAQEAVVPAIGKGAVLATADSVTVAGIAVAFLQWLKGAKWFTVLTVDSSTVVQRVYAIVVAVASAIGVNFTVVHTGVGSGTISYTGLTIAGIAAAGWVFVKTFTLQEITYRATIGSNSVAVKK